MCVNRKEEGFKDGEGSGSFQHVPVAGDGFVVGVDVLGAERLERESFRLDRGVLADEDLLFGDRYSRTFAGVGDADLIG